MVVGTFFLLDPSFYNGSAGLILVVIAVILGARAYNKSKTTEAAASTVTLLQAEVDVLERARDRMQDELTHAIAENEKLRATHSIEPVMKAIAEVMGGLTEATKEMVSEIRESNLAANTRHEAVLREIEKYDERSQEQLEKHDKRAQERHDAMMVPLVRMAETVGNGQGS